MLRTNRHRQILDLLQDRGECLVDELASACGVSDMTIRRDLQKLAEDGQVVRTHGGATPGNQISFQFQFLRRSQVQAEEKEQIGRAAAALVRDGQTIMLDSGSTTLALARYLIGRRNLTVITTSLPIASVLQRAPGVETLLLGGFVRRDSPDLVGALTDANLENLRADIAFVGADGMDSAGNVYNASLAVARMLSKMIAAADRAFVIADHTKLGRTALSLFGNAAQWDGLITDMLASPEFLSQLNAAGVTTNVVGQSQDDPSQREAIHG